MAGDLSTRNRVGLGLDAGGTMTRWMLLDAAQSTLAEGAAGGLSGLLIHSDHGLQRLRETLAQIAAEVRQALPPGADLRIVGGFTGVDSHSRALSELLANAFSLPIASVSAMSDIEIAYRAAFDPGEGYIVYAGTGSIAAYVDATGALHRAGGRGVGLDDGGGGYWMAREALRQIWRREDEAPGEWKNSPLACAVFERIGSSEWSASRGFFYARDRGEIGSLALALRDTAERDPISRDILTRAGHELARLGAAMIGRFGARPIALAGRAATLHSLIEDSLREQLPDATISRSMAAAHRSAAQAALGLVGVGFS